MKHRQAHKKKDVTKRFLFFISAVGGNPSSPKIRCDEVYIENGIESRDFCVRDRVRFNRGWSSLLVIMQKRENFHSIKFLATAEKVQFHHKREAGDFRAL